MLGTLRTLAARIVAPFRARGFEAAAGGRRWSGAGSVANPNADILAGATTIRRRARHQAANNPWVASGIASIVANMVGTGIKPQSTHPDQAVRTAINNAFERWTDESDADGLTDFYGQQAQAARAMVESGEAFARLEVGDGRGTVPLRVRAIDADQVDNALTRALTGGARIVGGIEFDASNRRLAYHIFKARPGDPLALNVTPLDTIRVPAADVVHLFAPLSPGQVRGVSWLASVLLRLTELDSYEDAQLMRQKVAALFAGFVVDPEGNIAGMQGTKTDSVLEAGLEPGTLKVLPTGADIRFSEPAQIGDAVDFLRLQLRAVAAGMGVTYEQLTGDLSGVNYSSIRAGLVEFRRRIEALQHSVVVYQFCRPIYRRFVTVAVLSGALPARDFERNPEAYLGAKWITPGFDWVDPQKDAAADAAAVAAGFKSRREVVAGRGYDVEQLDAEIAADQARAKQLGLAFMNNPAANTPNEAKDAND